jgi:hypothetical protein
MAPKGSDKGGGKGGKGEAAVPQLSILEATFPAWSDEIPSGKDAPKPDTSTGMLQRWSSARKELKAHVSGLFILLP